MPTYSKLWASKVWAAVVAACLAALVVAALILPQSFRLTALSDVIQCILLFSGTAALIPHAVQARGRLRLFWTFMASGIALWFSYQLFWTYYEIWLRADVPDLCAADIVHFHAHRPAHGRPRAPSSRPAG